MSNGVAPSWLSPSRAALVAAIVVIGALSWRLDRLAGQYEQLQERYSHPYTGMYVPELELPTLDGTRIQIGTAPEEALQVLFFFTTTCPYCRASVPGWRRLIERADRAGNVRVVGVSFESASATSTYREKTDLRAPIALTSGEEERVAALYRVRGVPLTLTVNDAGRVVHVRRGTFDDPADVDSLFSEMSLDAFSPPRTEDDGPAAPGIAVDASMATSGRRR